MNNSEFNKFVINYKPTSFEINDEHYLDEFKNTSTLITSLKRYEKIIEYVNKLKDTNKIIESVADIGPYPGTIFRVMKYFNKSIKSYYGIGLANENDFINHFSKLGMEFINTELDPEWFEPKEVQEWEIRNCDLVLFLDVIEHLINPINCLDNINSILKNGGYLIITTDNISSIDNVLNMVIRGSSSNVPLLQSNLFYRGDWRPHSREYSKDELYFLLGHCGFEVIKHEYFLRKQGEFKIDLNGNLSHNKKSSLIKGTIREFLISLSSHFRDHQIILARKEKNLAEIVNQRFKCTNSMKEWMDMRNSIS